MKHFPIFVALEGRRVVLSGGGEAAVAKLRLILKTEARAMAEVCASFSS
ncbi:MAG: NAD(P)-dependent oxidoreductase, partial [Pseudomonadota bacterium]